MRVHTLAVASFLLAFAPRPASALAPDLQVELKVLKSKLLPKMKIPLEITIKNTSGGPLRLSFARNAMLVMADDGKKEFAISEASCRNDCMTNFPDMASKAGSIEDYLNTPSAGKIIISDAFAPILSGRPPSDVIIVGFVLGPGDYSLYVDYAGPGKIDLGDRLAGPRDACNECWSGHVLSNKVKIHVDEPTGEDRLAYESCKCEAVSSICDRQELLAEHPESAYALYAARNRQEFSTKFPLQWLADRAAEPGLLGTQRVLQKNEGKWVEVEASFPQRVQYRKELFEKILALHSGIWFSDELRWSLAVDQIMLKNYKEGVPALERLALRPDHPAGKAAAEFLRLLREKKLIH